MTLAVNKRRRRSAPGQLVLTLTRQQKFALLRGAKFTLPDSKVRNFARVHQLLEQIEIHTGEKGCRVRIGLLAEKLHCSRDTVMRTTKLAERLGVLGVGRDRDTGNEFKRTGGNGPNWYKVFWDKVRGYCDKESIRNAEQDRPGKQETERVMRLREVRQSVHAESTGPEWDSIRKELRDFGVVNAGNAVNQAWANGLTPFDCRALLAYASGRPPGYWNDPAGVLYHRICNGSPASEPSQDWPKPSPKFELALKRAREAAREAEQEQRDRAAAVAVQKANAERAKHEAEFGQLLDRMPLEERDELARRVFRDGPLQRIYERDGIGGGLVRASLIQRLRKETART